MELNRLSFNPRKRSAYENFDLTVLLTKQHFLPLFSLYICLALPTFLILGFLLGWSIAAFAVWLLKPLFERPLLDYMSKAVFSQPTSIKSSILVIKQLKFKDMLAHLTVFRLSPNRAFLAPVEQLERLSAERKQKRKQVLFATSKPKQTLWMLFCVHFEFIVLMGLSAFSIALIPDSFSLEESIYQFQDSPAWLEIAFNLLYLLSISLVAPLFVTGGFLAYLHRRVELEGWDIELAFKNIKTRFAQPLSLIFACLLSFLAAMPQTSFAEELDKDAVKEQVITLYNQDDVIEKKTTWVPDFNFEQDNASPSSFDFSWLSNFFELIGFTLSYLVWGFVGLLALWLVYYLVKNKGFFTGLKLPEKSQKKSDHVIPSLFTDIKHDELPDDLISAALESYRSGNLRLALGYLLHHSLRWAQVQYEIKLHRSMTERECKQVIDASVSEQWQAVFSTLFSAWVSVAWGHRKPNIDFEQLAEQIKQMSLPVELNHET
ncbi:hypothetical protein EXT42_08690 [Pseudoalteromonas sp. CO302Y]|uniref:hypothetical protein n=1 Tax=unclassified Pseudoalteromonas TaxID=194690 RepID=UPI001023A33B|nr:hypothetical protein EXT42_08690 [Pseudoalteromonas sp. CO302Y]RZG09935.1 hypothetical protein EXT40_08700 [Pseudoalteromonas sp. CO133X]